MKKQTFDFTGFKLQSCANARDPLLNKLESMGVIVAPVSFHIGVINLALLVSGLENARDADFTIELPTIPRGYVSKPFGGQRAFTRFTKHDAITMASQALGSFIPVGILATMSAQDLTEVLKAFTK